jgi:hypothetical protein
MMNHFCKILLLIFISIGVATNAQTPVTTDGTGTGNKVPKYSGTNSLTASSITEVNGNVGIGTTTPSRQLDIGGIPSVVDQTNLRFGVLNGVAVSNADSRTLFINLTESPWSGVSEIGAFNYGAGSWIPLYIDASEITLGAPGRSSPNVGIGTVNPQALLDVAGNVRISGAGASLTFPDSTVQSTAWNGTTLGGDYAESIDVLGDRATYEPGDVIVIDDSETGKFDKSSKPYSKMVAGVYSTKPGLVGRRLTVDRPDKEAEVPMAMMGIVPTKVSTENGPIQRGDLLVSSSTPGYAMRGTDRNRLMGAVIGKALAPLKSGSGVIEALLALQ